MWRELLATEMAPSTSTVPLPVKYKKGGPALLVAATTTLLEVRFCGYETKYVLKPATKLETNENPS